MLSRRLALVAFLAVGATLAAPASAAPVSWFAATWHDIAAWFGAATQGCIPTEVENCGVEPPQ